MSLRRVLRVWAPRARAVEVELLDEGERVPMVTAEPGVFLVERARVIGRYQLLVDGEPTPNPWALDVASVLGPCRSINHAGFPWTDVGFQPPALEDGLVYELHVGCFTEGGTFDAAIARLPRLVELGVTHVELMPVATFSGDRGWGYDGAALFAPHPAYGGPDGLKRLVDAAHGLGLAVLLDVVYNHLGPVGNFLDRFGPFFREDRQTPWGRPLAFDGPDSDEVRRFFLDNALHWLRDYHLDGLRLDAVHAIDDASPMHFLEELATEVRRLGEGLGKRLVLVAESDRNDPRTIRPTAEHGLGMDAQWSDDFHHALHVALTGEGTGYYEDFTERPLSLVARALEHGFVYDGRYSRHLRRRRGRALGELPRTRLLGYAQTHDQIGNRARGERLAQLVSPGRLKIAHALVLTAPFVPMFFMGEEWGARTPFLYFTDHHDPGLADAVREGRRREFAAFGWQPDEVPDPQAPETFLASRLREEERALPAHQAHLAFVRALVALRRAEPALRDGAPGATHAVADDDRGTLVVGRGPFTIYCNLGPARVTAQVAATARVVLASDEAARLAGDRLELGPDSVVVLAHGRSAP